ncbi:hypothetical protein [Pseudomonas putida]|uniref:Uncharacterized protein n=1 Tax=Pseudomonas putida TaxID=303 RepID=A0A1Q9R0A6_PSEPU|nr:hypothetical protein [Pseudomonas putida]OLS60818.1 hypothetical protein PSEMO_43190 [Pseudomonas putida]
MRIRGHIGEWPVDLTIELGPEEWAGLARVGEAAAPVSSVAPTVQARPDDTLWLAAKELLRKAGEMEGPALLELLEGLAGSTAAGKRLLVRLRHSAEVKVESGADAPVYHWVG